MRIEHYDNEADWLEIRYSGIGGSEAAAILNESSYSTPMKLYAEKLRLVPPRPQTEWQEWGHLLEEPIAKKLAAVTGVTVTDPGEYAICRHESVPWMFCTPDRLLYRSESDVGLAEIKAITTHRRHNWDNGLPLEYQIQVQHNLAVTGLTWAIVPVLIGGYEFRHYEVDRNERFIAALMAAERRFWDHVQSRLPPAVADTDSSEATHEALALLYPDDSGAEVDLDSDTAHWAHVWRETSEEIKRLQNVHDVAEAKLRRAIGDATYATCPGGFRLSLKTQKVKAHVVNYPEQKFRVLRKAKTNGCDRDSEG